MRMAQRPQPRGAAVLVHLSHIETLRVRKHAFCDPNLAILCYFLLIFIDLISHPYTLFCAIFLETRFSAS